MSVLAPMESNLLPLRVLVVEDSPDDAELALRELARGPWEISWRRIETRTALEAALASEEWDIVLADYSLPGFSGIEALRICRREHPDLPFLLVSGTVGEELAVEAMKEGASDSIMKNKLARLRPAVERELREARERSLRRETERDLERFRTLVETSLDLVAAVGADGRIRYVNPMVRETLDYEPAELEGRSVEDLVHPDDVEAVREALSSAIDQLGQPRLREYRARRRDGTWRILEAAGRSTHDPSRGVEFLITARDITERRKGEEAQERLRLAVQEAAREWRLSFDSIDSPIVVLDRAQTILRLNVTAQRLIGSEFTDIVGRRLADLPGLLWARAAELAGGVASTSGRASVQLLDEETGQTWDLTGSFLAGDHPEDERIVVVALDVTPLVALQESLRKSETMSAMGALVAGVAHEVRNPLFAISATLDAFDLRFGDRGEYKKYAAALREQIERLTSLMHDLLDYGKPPTLQIQACDFAQLLEEAVRQCRDLAAQRGIEIRIEPTTILPAFKADAPRLVRVFLNLVQNAVQHAPRSTEITISSRAVRRTGGPWISCRIEDQGPGFRVEDLARIFDPFFSRRQGGTGLGLAIVRRIVEAHGGRVHVGNRDEGGAQVRVELPAAEALRGAAQ
jgi:PAS domain S-box-containing protein